MKDLTNNTAEEFATKPHKKSLLRGVARILALLSTLSYWVCAGIIAYIVFAGTTEVGSLFGHDEDVLGILDLTGFLAYVVIFIAVAVVIAIAAGCTAANAKYRRLARASKNFHPALFAVSQGVVGSIVYLYGVIAFFAVTWGFLMLWTGINNPVGYAGIVCIALQATTCIVATIERVICKEKFESLPEQVQNELRSQSHVIKETVKKVKKKKRIGKLY